MMMSRGGRFFKFDVFFFLFFYVHILPLQDLQARARDRIPGGNLAKNSAALLRNLYVGVGEGVVGGRILLWRQWPARAHHFPPGTRNKNSVVPCVFFFGFFIFDFFTYDPKNNDVIIGDGFFLHFFTLYYTLRYIYICISVYFSAVYVCVCVCM